MKFEKIQIGEFVMKGGARIPFAARKLNWKWGWDGITQIEYAFVSHRGIGLVNFVNWVNVDSIIVRKTVTKLKFKNHGE